MGHEPSLLAAFQQGERRLIFARRRDRTPGLHFLADGAADAEREWAKAQLICPVEACPMPELTTVNGGSRRRDHFRHLVGSYSHSAESLFHLEGKAQIAKWANEAYPNAFVRLEEASNKERDRIADVMVTFPDGGRIAIEIQYAALTPGAWQLRHDSYAEQGIRDLWLFGHTGTQLRDLGNNQVALTPTHELMTATGVPVLWFNPQDLLIGSATTTERFEQGHVEVFAGHSSGIFAARPLAGLELTPASGLTDERLARLSADTERYQRWFRLEQARLAAIELAREEVARAQAIAIAEARDRALSEFMASSEADAIRSLFRGEWPEFLRHQGRDIGVPSEIWQARLYLRYVETAFPGSSVSPSVCDAQLVAWFGLTERTDVTRAVAEWFELLVEHGVLESRSVTVRNGRRTVKHFHKPAAPRPSASSSGSSSERKASGSSDSSVTRQHRLPMMRNSGPVAPALGRASPTGFTCAACGEPLDKLLAAATRFHTGCDPAQRRRY